MATNAVVDPRSPVIVGVGQVLDRQGGLEPIDLAASAIALAESDSGVSGLAARAEIIGVVPIVSWRYFDPAERIAEMIGASPSERWYPAMGGNTPQLLVNKAAFAIAAGDADIAIVCGAESYQTRMAARKAGTALDWTHQDDSMTPTWGDAQKLDMGHPAEVAHGIFMPVQCYPLFENAIRHHLGRDAATHTRAISELWSRFSAVAVDNPYAVDRTHHSAEEIATVTASNRMIGSPYTKHMVSNPDLDASSAVIMCSAATAEELGISRDRWVFVWAGTDANESKMSERTDFVSCAAMGIAGNTAVELSGRGIDDIAHLDVYSCFPSAVELACAELKISLDRQLTVYGGLCFAGGPWNNPVGHAIASMVDVLRNDAGSHGLVTANGGIIQKHSFGVYSTTPPPNGFRYANPQFAVDAAAPLRMVAADHVGPATVETWTVMFERDGTPARAHAAVLTAEGARSWGVTKDPDAMSEMLTADMVGRSVRLEDGGELTLA